MLDLPESGLRVSVNSHNVIVPVLTDWIELTSVFGAYENYAKGDFVDVLMENGIYRDQDFAWEGIELGWREVRRRMRLLSEHAPLVVDADFIQRKGGWEQNVAHSFLLILSVPAAYPSWAREFGPDYTQQGELFEKLAEEALGTVFGEWSIYRTGWSRSSPVQIADVIEAVAQRMGSKGNAEPTRWVSDESNEEGLDIVCHRDFGDGYEGVPAFFIQCASGRNWEKKLRQPDTELWKTLLDMAGEAKRILVIPFSLQEDEMRKKANRAGGPLIDRYRLLIAARRNPDWMSAELRASISEWLGPRVERLPRMTTI